MSINPETFQPRPVSLVTLSVTEERERAGNTEEELRRRPRPGTSQGANYEISPEVSLVSIGAVREYIALLWERYQTLRHRGNKRKRINVG